MPAFGSILTSSPTLNAAWGDHASDHLDAGVDPLSAVAYSRWVQPAVPPTIPVSSEPPLPLLLDDSQGPTLALSTSPAPYNVANAKVTIPTGYGGIWLITAVASIQSNAAGQYRDLQISVNAPGNLLYVNSVVPHGLASGIAENINSACLLKLNSGDYFWLSIFHDASAALTATWSMEAVRLG